MLADYRIPLVFRKAPQCFLVKIWGRPSAVQLNEWALRVRTNEQAIGPELAALIRGAILKQILKHEILSTLQSVHGIVALRVIVARPPIKHDRMVPRNKECDDGYL